MRYRAVVQVKSFPNATNQITQRASVLRCAALTQVDGSFESRERDLRASVQTLSWVLSYAASVKRIPGPKSQAATLSPVWNGDTLRFGR